MPVFLSIFRKGPSEEAYCALLYHRCNCAIGIQAVLDSHHWQDNKRKPLATWPLLFLEGLWLAFHWIGLVENLYSPYSLYAAVLQAQLCLTLHGVSCHAAQMKAKHSADGLICLQWWARSFDACLASFYLGRDSHWHYRLLQAHLKIIACMIAIFLTSLRRCSLCLGINGCSILDRGKAVSFHVSVKGCIFSTIHFNSAHHAVLISWSFFLLQNGEHSLVLLRCATLL